MSLGDLHSLLHTRDRHRGHSFSTPERAHAFIRRRLDPDLQDINPERRGDLPPHGLEMRPDLRRFRNQRRIHVRDPELFLRQDFPDPRKISRLLIPRIASSVFGK